MLCRNAPFPSRELMLKPIVVAATKERHMFSFSKTCHYYFVTLALEWKTLNLPQTMSNVREFMNGKISKHEFPACLSNWLSIYCAFSLKIGTNDCKIFKLKLGFIAFLNGFQNVPAMKGERGKNKIILFYLVSMSISVVYSIVHFNLLFFAYIVHLECRTVVDKIGIDMVCRGNLVT